MEKAKSKIKLKEIPPDGRLIYSRIPYGKRRIPIICESCVTAQHILNAKFIIPIVSNSTYLKSPSDVSLWPDPKGTTTRYQFFYKTKRSVRQNLKIINVNSNGVTNGHAV